MQLLSALMFFCVFLVDILTGKNFLNGLNSKSDISGFCVFDCFCIDVIELLEI